MPLPAALLAPLLLAVSADQSPTDGCPGVFVFFATDSVQLDRQATALLDSSWSWLGEMVAAGAWINLHAGTDDVGSASYNLALSQRRAEAVRHYYLGRGASPDQVRIVAYGETRPLAEFDGRRPAAQVRAENRNVNIWPEMPVEVYRRFFPPGGPVC